MTAADVPDAVRPVAPGEVVDGVSHGPGQELLELGHAGSVLGPDGVAALTYGRSRRDQRDVPPRCL